jgi:hypothetical protein
VLASVGIAPDNSPVSDNQPVQGLSHRAEVIQICLRTRQAAARSFNISCAYEAINVAPIVGHDINQEESREERSRNLEWINVRAPWHFHPLDLFIGRSCFDQA